MRKFIRNLLVGVTTSFWPTEKASAEFSILDFPEFLSSEGTQAKPVDTTVDTNSLDKILNNEYKSSTPLAGTEQIKELLELIEEAESNGWAFAESEKTTNVLDKVQLDVADQQVLRPDLNLSPVETNKTLATAVSPQEPVIAPTNTPTFVQNTQTNVIDSVLATTNDTASVSKTIDSVPTNTVLSVKENDSTNLLQTASVKESVLTPTQTVVETFSPSCVQIQPDLENLLTALESQTPVQEKKEAPAPKKTEEPTKDKNWFLNVLSGVLGGVLVGAFWFTDKLRSKKNKISQVSKVSENTINSEKAETVVSEETKLPSQTPIRSQKMVRKRKKPQVEKINMEDDPKAHQKGVKMLANIKLRRSAINRRMKALRTEIARYHQSEPRFLEITNEMAALQEERNQLTREHRLARTLVKGKEGERIQQERRLIAKEIRLIKKSNDTDIERIKEVINKRALLSAQDKALVKAAENEAKERLSTADWWHGKRLYQEAIAKEKELNERVRCLKKETGLKKSEILELEDDIREGLQKVRRQKSLATRQMKGAQCTNQKRSLAKQIIEAHVAQDLNAENQLKEKLQEVKIQEKEYVKWSKAFDYAEGRRTVVPSSVQHHAERRDLANSWKGYRMLRDLNQGQVSAVKTQQITAKAYQAQALSLIGKKYDASFNYEAERASCLKPSTLASIYLSHKRKGLA